MFTRYALDQWLIAAQRQKALWDEHIALAIIQNHASGAGKDKDLVKLEAVMPLMDEFYKKVLDKEAGQVKALWSKLVFTGKATMPKEVAGSAAVKAAVAANPKAIGYIEKSAVDATVKVVFTAP